MHWIDCGLNLLSSQFADPETVLASAVAANVSQFVLISSDLQESEAVAAFCAGRQDCIGTAGVHPHQAEQVADGTLEQLFALAEQPHIRAIGECGLDYNRNFSPPKVQRTVFAKQVEIAVQLQLPLYLHERDATDDQIAILAEHQGSLPPLFVHCFTQGREALERYQAFDAYFGITGWVCDERRGKELAQAVPLIRQDRLLLETDAPYLLPRTLRPKPTSRINYPHYLPHVGEYVARLRETSVKELAEQVNQNAYRLFGEWPCASGNGEVMS
ncbi:MAG: TatD family hydrolase [Idiomarinaceae bacterium HL-53]|nr:MAG: TatD family hydrolase [Idiomarinaceae bacterium HL-53]CUS48132.1 Sec-independent protein translocase TatD [Idiomarinaceae bacterium HL-53]